MLALMSEAIPKKRIRLSREARQEMILDHAATIVAEDGVSGVTMEALGRSMKVSKSLLYAYYPTLTELLRALLHREYKRLRIQNKTAMNFFNVFFTKAIALKTNFICCFHDSKISLGH